MPSGLVINDVKDALTIASQILESAKEEVVWLIPASINSLSIRYSFVEKVQTFIQEGGTSRGIIPISHANLEEIRLFLAVGETIRHSDDVHELFMYVGDKQKSVSSINIGVEEFTLDTPVTAFWSESPEYAEYLLTAFEGAWSQAIPAEERIRELLGQQVEQS